MGRHRFGTVKAENRAEQTVVFTEPGDIDLDEVRCSNGSRQRIGSMKESNITYWTHNHYNSR